MTVPARPQSTKAGPCSRSGVTVQPVLPMPISTATPRARRPSAISLVSRESSTPVIDDGPVACAARMRARLLCDLEPGTSTVPDTGPVATGAAQPCVAIAVMPASAPLSSAHDPVSDAAVSVVAATMEPCAVVTPPRWVR